MWSMIASVTSRQVSICGSTCSGKRAPKASSRLATISIRSSESRPSSTMLVSSVRLPARSLAIRRTCSKTVCTTSCGSSRSGRCGRAASPTGRIRASRGWSVAAGAATGCAGASQATCCSITSRLPSRNWRRAACRWILPLDVLGMLLGRTSTIASTANSWPVARRRRMASKASVRSAASRRPRSTSATTTTRSRSSTSTAKAATEPARIRPLASSTDRSMSCG